MRDSQEAQRRLGRRLRQIREARGLTQDEVAERAGFSGKYVSEIERGRRDPPVGTLRAIAEDGLGASLAELFEGLRGVDHAMEPVARYERLPVGIRRIVDELRGLGSPERTRVVAIFRGILALRGTHDEPP